MSSLITKVKSKMALYAHDKVRSILEGEYGSVFKGRSMDFDDLREYIPGDDVKDIDWKSTARSGTMRVRRYVAIRKHNIMFVVDTGKNMSAVSESGDSKKDVAIMTTGMLGYLALKHGDLVGLIAGDSTATKMLPLKESYPHLELLLQHIDTSVSAQGAPSNMLAQLEYIATSIRRRMMLVIIADDIELSAAYIQVLKRLRAQHEMLWVTIGDTSGLDACKLFYDIDHAAVLASYIQDNKALKDAFDVQAIETQQEHKRQLDRLGIASGRLTGEADVVPTMIALLERQKHARRR